MLYFIGVVCSMQCNKGRNGMGFVCKGRLSGLNIIARGDRWGLGTRVYSFNAAEFKFYSQN